MRVCVPVSSRVGKLHTESALTGCTAGAVHRYRGYRLAPLRLLQYRPSVHVQLVTVQNTRLVASVFKTTARADDVLWLDIRFIDRTITVIVQRHRNSCHAGSPARAPQTKSKCVSEQLRIPSVRRTLTAIPTTQAFQTPHRSASQSLHV